MKKIFFLAAAMWAAVTMNAQRIEFGDAVVAAADFGTEKVFTNGEVELVATNVAKKMSIDANKTKFGTSFADSWQSTYRLKTGGASSVAEGKELGLRLYVPSAGVVKVYARSGGSSAIRNFIMKQDETEVLNVMLSDEDAITDTDDKGESVKIFPIYTSEKVAEGYIDFEFGRDEANKGGGMYIYAFEFVPEEGQGIENTTTAFKAHKIVENGQIIIVRDGVRYNALGAVVD